jgi:glycerol-3-phosphate acyltransferase PlsY
MSVVLVCGLAFALGAIPFALLVVRACKGIDVRTVGSGNVGATNASRAFATQSGRLIAFAAIYALDAAKGFVPAWWGPEFAPALPAMTVGVLGGSAAVLGHVFTPLLGFRGGKGVATAAGVFGVLAPAAVGAATALFVVVVWATKYISVGSMAAAIALAVAAGVAEAPAAVVAGAGLAAVIIIHRHRGNLSRVLAGTERRVGQRLN